MVVKYLNRFRYALCNGQIMCIDDVTKEIRQSSTFTCIGCGHEMSAALGDVREHYFRHKNSESCSHETYLHNLAKKRIKELFDSQDSFLIHYKAKNSCDLYGTCKLHRCENSFWQKIDLKVFFDTCELEKVCGNFRPDVLLTHSKFPNRKLFIEIHVKNPCSQEKIDSGIKIIEIDVFNEDTIIYPFHEQFKNVHFYNFKFNRKIVPSSKLDRFSLVAHEDGTKEFKIDSVDCFKKDEHIENAEFDMIINKPNDKVNLKSLGLAQTMIRGNNVLTCAFCRKFNNCVVTITQTILDDKSGKEIPVTKNYWARGLSENDHWMIASQCKNYIPNINKCHNLIQMYGSHRFILWERDKNK